MKAPQLQHLWRRCDHQCRLTRLHAVAIMWLAFAMLRPPLIAAQSTLPPQLFPLLRQTVKFCPVATTGDINSCLQRFPAQQEYTFGPDIPGGLVLATEPVIIKRPGLTLSWTDPNTQINCQQLPSAFVISVTGVTLAGFHITNCSESAVRFDLPTTATCVVCQPVPVAPYPPSPTFPSPRPPSTAPQAGKPATLRTHLKGLVKGSCKEEREFRDSSKACTVCSQDFRSAVVCPCGSSPNSANLRQVRFTGNSGSSGAAVYVSNTSITIQNCSFVSNSALVAGSAVYMDTGGKLFVEGCKFERNSGSTIHVAAGGFLSMLTASEFVNNSGVSINLHGKPHSSWCGLYNAWRKNAFSSSQCCTYSSTVQNSIFAGNTGEHRVVIEQWSGQCGEDYLVPSVYIASSLFQQQSGGILQPLVAKYTGSSQMVDLQVEGTTCDKSYDTVSRQNVRYDNCTIVASQWKECLMVQYPGSQGISLQSRNQCCKIKFEERGRPISGRLLLPGGLPASSGFTLSSLELYGIGRGIQVDFNKEEICQSRLNLTVDRQYDTPATLHSMCKGRLRSRVRIASALLATFAALLLLVLLRLQPAYYRFLQWLLARMARCFGLRTASQKPRETQVQPTRLRNVFSVIGQGIRQLGAGMKPHRHHLAAVFDLVSDIAVLCQVMRSQRGLGLALLSVMLLPDMITAGAVYVQLCRLPNDSVTGGKLPGCTSTLLQVALFLPAQLILMVQLPVCVLLHTTCKAVAFTCSIMSSWWTDGAYSQNASGRPIVSKHDVGASDADVAESQLPHQHTHASRHCLGPMAFLDPFRVIDPIKYSQLWYAFMACTESPASIGFVALAYIADNRAVGQTPTLVVFVVSALSSAVHILINAWEGTGIVMRDYRLTVRRDFSWIGEGIVNLQRDATPETGLCVQQDDNTGTAGPDSRQHNRTDADAERSLSKRVVAAYMVAMGLLPLLVVGMIALFLMLFVYFYVCYDCALDKAKWSLAQVPDGLSFLI